MAHTKFPLVIIDPPGRFVVAWKEYLRDVVAATTVGRRDFSQGWVRQAAATAESNRARKGIGGVKGRSSSSSSASKATGRGKKRKERGGKREEPPPKKARESGEATGEGASGESPPGHGRATGSSST